MIVRIKKGGVSPKLSYSNALFSSQMNSIMERINAVYGGRLRLLVSDVWDSRESAWGSWLGYTDLSSYLVNVSPGVTELICCMAFLILDQSECPSPVFYMRTTTTNINGGDSIAEESKVPISSIESRDEIARGEVQNPGEGIPSIETLPLFFMLPISHEPNFTTSHTQKITFAFKMESNYLVIQPFSFWVFETPMEEI